MILQRAGIPFFSSFTLRNHRRNGFTNARVRRGKAGAERAAVGAAMWSTTANSTRLPFFGAEKCEHDVLNDNGFDYDEYQTLKQFIRQLSDVSLPSACESVYDYIQEVPNGYWVDKIEGVIPAELNGTYFKNGPGDVNFLNEPVSYSFDANGMMLSVSIKEGKAFFRSRFVKTEHSILEERAERRLFKGPFGTQPKHGILPFCNLVNRNAASGMPFLGKGRLYAPYEGCSHSELDPVTLQTLYPTLPDGLLPATVQVIRKQLGYTGDASDVTNGATGDGSDILNPRKVSGLGDSKYDKRRGVTICHTYRPAWNLRTSSLGTELGFYEFDEDLRLHSQQKHSIDGFTMVHAIGVSENYYVVSKAPMYFEPRGLLDPSNGLANCVRYDPEGVHEFHLVPRPSSIDPSPTRKSRVYKMKEASFVFHFVNVHEEGDQVITDSVHYSAFPPNSESKTLDSGSWKKTGIDPKLRRTICYPDGTAESHELCSRCMEMFTINPSYVGRDYRYAYMLAGLHPTEICTARAIGKMDFKSGRFDMWSKDPFHFPTEPLFVPRPGGVEEDDGWVLSFCWNSSTKKTEFVIFDAKAIEQGPVATLYLDHAVPPGFHAIWSSQYYGP